MPRCVPDDAKFKSLEKKLAELSTSGCACSAVPHSAATHPPHRPLARWWSLAQQATQACRVAPRTLPRCCYNMSNIVFLRQLYNCAAPGLPPRDRASETDLTEAQKQLLSVQAAIDERRTTLARLEKEKKCAAPLTET